MKSFKTWLEDNNQENQPQDQTINQNTQINQPKPQNIVGGPLESQTKKSWSGRKQEIIDFWKAIPQMPLLVDPIPSGHKGSTFGEDGIRITGSPNYIYSVLARLKDFLPLESDGTKLQLLFKESDRLNPNKPNKKSYAFYIQVKQRGSSSKPKTS
jgi:hypothetical protein